MIISISAQFRLVLFSISAGIITGILFDIYRIIRGFTELNKIVELVEDALFWIFAGMIVFIFLMYTNYAYTDVYVYLCISAGIYLYFKLLSKIFSNIEKKIFRFTGRLIRVVVNVGVYPFQFIIYSFKTKKRENHKK